jgi:phospholipid transport system substrate-binding protein
MTASSTTACNELTRRSALAAGFAAALRAAFAPGPARAAAAADAEQFIQQLGDEAIEISQGGDPTARLDEVTALLDQTADVPLIARLVLGRHWRDLGAAQRQEFVAVFRDYILGGIARRLGGSGGVRKVAVTGSRRARGDDSMVRTEVTLANGGPPARVDWRVRGEDGSGDFKIIDVVAEGVSLVVTTRSEFDSAIARGGIDGLLDLMRQWGAESAAGSPSGSPRPG